MAKILITDDSDFMRELISVLIEADGYDICFATTGEETIDKYVAEKPDAVVLDIVMAGMNGLETLEKLVKMDSNAKVIVCSALVVQNKVQQEAMEKGAYMCVPKPFNGKELRLMIKNCLEG